MPHSKSGKAIAEGDRVVMSGVVKAVSCNEEGCNITVVLDAEACAPAHAAEFSLNAKFVELDEPAPLPDTPAAG